jgi:hypothetical protein
LSPFIEVVEGLDLPRLDRDQLRLAAGVLDRLPGLGQLDLLDPGPFASECLHTLRRRHGFG